MGNAEYMGSFIKTMAQQGASLQNYNNELVKCLEDLREKREAINREIAREEDDKNKCVFIIFSTQLTFVDVSGFRTI